MKTQTRAGAVLLAGILAGSTYGMTLTLQQGAQDNSNQQQNKDSKKKKNDQQNTNTNNAQPNTPPPANNPPPTNSPPGNPASGDKPTPLFGGTIGLKSSRQTKDSATLGFNGVDPNGQVQKAMLSAAATPADAMKAQQMAQVIITPADLAQFLQDGGLNPDAVPQKP
jgi:hypothetical protein